MPRPVRFNAPWRPVPWTSHAGWFDGIGRDASKIVLVIRKEQDGPAIGITQLIDIHSVHRSAELTIRIGQDADRGKGYGTQALKLALDFARRDLNLHRVWLRVYATNERAVRAYAKAGLHQEGVMRQAAWVDGAWVDEVLMASLTEEFLN